MSAAAIGATATVLAHWVTPAAFALLLFASIALLGAGMGTVNPVSSQVLFVATPPQYCTVAFLATYLNVALGMPLVAVIGPLLFTTLVAATGHYTPSFIVSAIPVLVLAVVMLASRPRAALAT